MKKSFFGPLITVIVLILVIALFVFFYVSMNKMEKRITVVQQSIGDNSAKLNAIVNFFNSATNAKATK